MTQKQIVFVKQGDTLSETASKYGVTLGELLAENPKFCEPPRNPDLIYPDEPVVIPASSKFDPALDLKTGVQGCKCPQSVAVKHKSDNPACSWSAISAKAPAVIALGETMELMAIVTPDEELSRVRFKSSDATILGVEPKSLRSTDDSLSLTASQVGTAQVTATCNGNILLEYPVRVISITLPLLVAWSDRRPGLKTDGTVANDMKYGDYTAAQIQAVDWTFNWLDADEMTAADKDFHFANLRRMATSLFALGDLEDNIEKMIDHFEGSTGSDYSNPALTDAVREHESTKRFVNQIRTELNLTLKKARGNLNMLATPGALTLTGRPHFSSNADKRSGLTIAINDTWAYDVYVDTYVLTGRCWQGEFRLVLWDHFGLDEPDVNSSRSYELLNGFRSWFILQHLDVLAYRPFMTKIELSGFRFEGGL